MIFRWGVAVLLAGAWAAPAPAQNAPYCTIKTGTERRCAEPVEIPEGYREADNPALLAEAQRAAGEGGICCGRVVEAVTPQVVFRAWAPHYPPASTAPAGYVASDQFGGWWSPTEPPPQRAQYRAQDDICTMWTTLALVTRCELKPGVQAAIGPGQSATCDDGTSYPQSPVIQLYLAAGSQDDVENCTTVVWPPGN